MKKILISILIFLILTNIFCFYNTFAQENSVNENINLNYTKADFSLTHFNLETQEVSNLSLSPSINLASDSSIDEISGYNPEAGISPTYVIGDDEREIVQNTSIYPYKCIGRLVTLYENGEVSHSTAFLIGKNVALTAGHCLQSKDNGKAVLIQFYPGYKNDGNDSYCLKISNAFAPNYWTKDYNPEYDWGLIVTEEVPKDGIGWLGVRYYAHTDCIGKNVTLTGYPEIIEGNVTKKRLAIYCQRNY